MGNLRSVSVYFCFFFIAMIISDSDAFLIESKLDGSVLTVSQQKAPPSGPYERLGVTLQKALNRAPEQQWKFINIIPSKPNEGYIRGFGTNAITFGLLGDDQYGFFNNYNIGSLTSDGKYRLLIKTPMFSNKQTRCIKNPGNGGFHEEAECNIDDVSQLWRFVKKSSTQ